MRKMRNKAQIEKEIESLNLMWRSYRIKAKEVATDEERIECEKAVERLRGMVVALYWALDGEQMDFGNYIEINA